MTKPSSTQLPQFERPPVTEVALAVQFDPVTLRAVDLAAISLAFADDFPTVEEQSPRPPMSVEQGPKLSFELRGGFDQPNLQFINNDRDRIVQFQRDRLVVNWRRRPDEDYPRYEGAVRPMFVDAWRRLSSVLADLGQEALKPNICEVVYVNVIDSGQGMGGATAPADVLALWNGSHSDSFLPSPSQFRVSVRYPLPVENGWLGIESTAIRRSDNGGDAMLLQLSATGMVESPGLEGALDFLDIGREWVVKGFFSFTTNTMHKRWGIV